jgi:hypothetical protein
MITYLKPLATSQGRVHHANVARDRITISYRPELLGDLRGQLEALANLRDSHWFGRPWADIGGHILSTALQAEITKQGLSGTLDGPLTVNPEPPVMDEPPRSMRKEASS